MKEGLIINDNMIQYHNAFDIEEEIRNIVNKLDLKHVDLSRLVCIRSKGSTSRYILARCHTISKIVQKALGIKAHYIIEVVSEKFDRLPKEEQIKVLIHEVMHVPKAFGGGFKHHNYVNKRSVEKMYKKYRSY